MWLRSAMNSSSSSWAAMDSGTNRIGRKRSRTTRGLLGLPKGCIEDLATVNESDHPIRFASIGYRNPAVYPGLEARDELTERSVRVERLDHRAGRPQLARGHTVQPQRVAYPAVLVGAHRPSTRGQPGENEHFVLARNTRSRGSGQACHDVLDDLHDRPRGPDHDSNGSGDHGPQLLRIPHPQALGHDLGHRQDEHREHRREGSDGGAPEALADHGPAPGRADRVRHGVDREDGRDRLLDVLTKAREALGAADPSLSKQLDLRRRDGVQRGLEEAAQEGGEEGESRDEEDGVHRS